MALFLGDFDQSGLDIDCLALLEVTGSPVLYADSDRGGSGVPLSGELGLAAGQTLISRIWWNGSTFRLNDNDNPVNLALSDYFPGAGLRIYLQIEGSAVVSFLSDDFQSAVSGARIQYTGLPAAVTALLDGLAVGDEVLFAVGAPSPVSVDVEVEATAALSAEMAGDVEVAPEEAVYADVDLGVLIAPFLWEGSVLLDPGLIEGAAVGYLRLVRNSGGNVLVSLSATAGGDAGLVGPRFRAEIEEFAEAFILESGDGSSITLKGPNHPANSFQDPSEPYFWTPDNNSELVAWDTGRDVSLPITFRIYTPQVRNHDASVEASAALTGDISGHSHNVPLNVSVEATAALSGEISAVAQAPINLDAGQVSGDGSLTADVDGEIHDTIRPVAIEATAALAATS